MLSRQEAKLLVVPALEQTDPQYVRATATAMEASQGPVLASDVLDYTALSGNEGTLRERLAASSGLVVVNNQLETLPLHRHYDILNSVGEEALNLMWLAGATYGYGRIGVASRPVALTDNLPDMQPPMPKSTQYEALRAANNRITSTRVLGPLVLERNWRALAEQVSNWAAGR